MAAKNGPNVAFYICIIFLTAAAEVACGAQYLGKFLGKLTEYHHGVSGEVYAVDSRTLHLKNFHYDGQGPAAYFYAGNSRIPSNSGFRIRDEDGKPDVIRRYRGESLTLTLPEGKTLNNIKWFSVWCEEFAVNFGDVKIPRNFDYPRPQKIDGLKGVHGVSSDNIVIVDAQTLLIPNFSYDGEAPDAKFWVGRGPKPSPQGVRVPDENGKEVPLRRYDRKTIVLTLPGDLTVSDIGHFGVWCEAFTVDFGHIQVPQNMNVPPSLRMLGVSPQSKLNCEVLHDDLAFEVRWAVAGDSIVLQLVSKLEDREYMSFGISGDDARTEMIGGDVVVAWIDKATLKGYADDYYLQDKAQCAGPKGSCPDERFEPNTNNIRLLNAAMVNGYSIVTYQRPLKASDQYDRRIYTNQSQAIIWAVGPLNQRDEVSFHSKYTKGDRFIEFGRAAKWNCPKPSNGQPSMQQAPVQTKEGPAQTRPAPAQSKEVEALPLEEPSATPDSPPPRSRSEPRKRGPQSSEPTLARSRARGSRDRVQAKESNNSPRQVPTPAPVAKRDPWEIPPIQCHEPEDGVFYAQMGPTGGKRGYPAITGHVGWGISWYINGLLIPEINVVRGKTYTFVVEGGLDPEISAKYHPFYITDDPVGGYAYKTAEEKAKVKVFAGVKQGADGEAIPSGTGRLCHWTHQGDSEAEDFESFGAYQRTLELKCDQGEPGIVEWTPDRNTPDTVYYQCFTHRYLGWKINVLDACDTDTAASEQKLAFALPESAKNKDDLEDSPSIRVESRVPAPNNIANTNDKEGNADGEIPQTIISNSFTQPLVQLQTDIPFFLQPPSNYYSQPLYLQNPSTPHPNTYNHLMYSNLHLANPHHDSFKPSPTLDTLPHEGKKSEIQAEDAQNFTTSSTAPPPPPPPFSETSTTATTKTILDAQPINHNNYAPKLPLHVQKPAHSKPSKVFVRYPLTKHLPPFSHHSHLMRPQKSPPIFVLAPPNFSMPPTPYYKKPLNPPFLKAAAADRPYTFTFPLPKFQGKPPPNRPQIVYMRNNPPIKKTPILIATKAPKLVQPIVEISPQQPATEREPVAQTTQTPFTPTTTPATTTTTTPEQYVQSSPAILAVNTGFNPKSVIIEGGFKPILSKEIQDRMIDIMGDEPELDYESERGMIAIDDNRQTLQRFKPMFVPSPMVVQNKSHHTNKMQKRRASSNSLSKFESAEEVAAAAAERVDAYYLPPDNQKPMALSRMEASNFELPPGIVVTYDGRTVPGSSLSAMPPQIASKGMSRPSSKTSDLIKSSPQFKPFGGDWPPLDPKFITNNAPTLHYQGPNNNNHRHLPSTSYTKLTLVRPFVGLDTEDVADATTEARRRRRRRKRDAHHTPEHTAEQAQQQASERDHQDSHEDHNHHSEQPSTTSNAPETVQRSTLIALLYAILLRNLV